MKRKLCAVFAALLAFSMTGCGDTSASDSTPAAETTAEQGEDEHRVEYSNIPIYHSENCNIELTAIEKTYGYGSHAISAPFDAVEIYFLVENTSGGSLSYTAQSIIINGFEVPTDASKSIKFYLDDGTKTVASFRINHEELNNSNIKQIESIRFKDSNIEISGTHENLSGAECTLDEPYVLDWE